MRASARSDPGALPPRPGRDGERDDHLPVPRAAPVRSRGPRTVAGRARGDGRVSADRTRAATATGAPARKIACQPPSSTSRPPTGGPTAAASVTIRSDRFLDLGQELLVPPLGQAPHRRPQVGAGGGLATGDLVGRPEHRDHGEVRIAVVHLVARAGERDLVRLERVGEAVADVGQVVGLESAGTSHWTRTATRPGRSSSPRPRRYSSARSEVNDWTVSQIADASALGPVTLR